MCVRPENSATDLTGQNLQSPHAVRSDIDNFPIGQTEQTPPKNELDHPTAQNVQLVENGGPSCVVLRPGLIIRLFLSKLVRSHREHIRKVTDSKTLSCTIATRAGKLTGHAMHSSTDSSSM